MKKFIIFVLTVNMILLSCNSGNPSLNKKTDSTIIENKTPDSTLKNKEIKLDTITRLDLLKEGDSAIFKSPTGQYYFVNSVQEPIEPLPGNDSINAAPTTVNPPCDGEAFDGIDRKTAKLSIATASLQNYGTVANLIATLPADDIIGHSHPSISTDAASVRVASEKRNVHINQAWLYTFKREGDEDYHVIIGSTPNKNTAVFFNIEISGLPKTTVASYQKLAKARKDFKDFFGINNVCNSSYSNKFKDNPVPIEIKGSIFFDQLHYTDHTAIGPADARSQTYWEIHPVTYVRFH
jgi:hypothetical protein